MHGVLLRVVALRPRKCRGYQRGVCCWLVAPGIPCTAYYCGWRRVLGDAAATKGGLLLAGSAGSALAELKG